MKIFLVDDEYINNLINSKMLSRVNDQLEVLQFTDPVKGYNKIESERPDLIFLDLNMPVLGGWSFLEKMYAECVFCRVVIVTSSVCWSDKSRAFTFNNVIGYLEKPLTKEKVSQFVTEEVQVLKCQV